MPPVIAQIADQLVAMLAEPDELSQPLVPKRTYDPVEELADKALKVSVVPRSESHARQTRGTNLHRYEVDLAVQQKVDPKNNEQGDVLTALVEEITGYVDRHWYLEIDGKLVEPAGGEVLLWLPRHMRELRQFTSVVTFRFTLERKRL